MDAELQLRNIRNTVLRIGGHFGDEAYQDVCKYALTMSDIDWSRSQHGRLIRLAQQIVRRIRYKVHHPPKNQPACFTDVSDDFDPERFASRDMPCFDQKARA